MSHKRFAMAIIPLFSAFQQSYCALVARHYVGYEWLHVSLLSAFVWAPTEVDTALFSCYMAGATWNCCRLGACSVCTMQPCISLQNHFIRSHILRIHVCLAVTCHLHFWQNDWDLLRLPHNTGGGTYRYRNMSQHRKLTLGKKILLTLLLGFELETFWSRVRRSTSELSRIPDRFISP